MKILITGATGAFGSELAKAFKGHKLILHGRNETKFPKLKCKTIVGDFGYVFTVSEIISECENVDVFINSAAVFQHCPLEELKRKDICDIIETNLTHPIIILKRVIDIFKKRGSGTIININSAAGKMGNAMEAVYCATKHGMKGFLDSVRYDCIQHGVKVIEIFPGAMSTGMGAHKEGYENFTSAKELSEFVTHIVDTKTFFSTGIEIHRAIHK